ncbi:MAG TPA: hypothetical protein DCY40_05580 [Actinobacteria bacterium]|nr:hypothetical protein [Actinomycetota bacterium]
MIADSSSPMHHPDGTRRRGASHDRSSRWGWAAITGALVLHWVAFFPAVMSYDSLNQWDQVRLGEIVDWHPAAHTLLFGALQKLFGSPAAAAALQVLLLSLLFYVALRLSASLHPDNTRQRWGTVAFVIASPVIGLYSVTLWKDVIFAIAIAAATLFAVRAEQGAPRGVRAVVFLAVNFSVIALFRKSGIVVLGLIVIAWFLSQRQSRRVLVAASLSALALIGTVRYGVFRAFDVAPNDAQAATLPFFFLARVVVSGDGLKPENQELVTQVQSLEVIKETFDPYRVDYLLADGTDWGVLADRASDFFRAAIEEGLESPRLVVRHLVDTGGLAWYPLPRGDRLYIGPTNIEWYAYSVDFGLRSSEVPVLTGALTWRVRNTASGLLLWLVWRPGVYLWILVASGWWWLRRLRRCVSILGPAMASAVVVALANPAPDVRYMFPTYLSLVVLVPFMTRVRQRPPKIVTGHESP